MKTLLCQHTRQLVIQGASKYSTVVNIQGATSFHVEYQQYEDVPQFGDVSLPVDLLAKGVRNKTHFDILRMINNQFQRVVKHLGVKDKFTKEHLTYSDEELLSFVKKVCEYYKNDRNLSKELKVRIRGLRNIGHELKDKPRSRDYFVRELRQHRRDLKYFMEKVLVTSPVKTEFNKLVEKYYRGIMNITRDFKVKRRPQVRLAKGKRKKKTRGYKNKKGANTVKSRNSKSK